MDSVVTNALKKKRKLELELSRINAFLDTYEELSGNRIIRDEMLSTSDKTDSQNESSTDLMDSPKRRNNLKKLLAVASRLIREAGRPLTRGEIVEGMDRLNVTIHAADKSKYIGTLLWRNKDMFRSTGGDGYDLVAKPAIGLPPAPTYGMDKIEDGRQEQEESGSKMNF